MIGRSHDLGAGSIETPWGLPIVRSPDSVLLCFRATSVSDEIFPRQNARFAPA